MWGWRLPGSGCWKEAAYSRSQRKVSFQQGPPGPQAILSFQRACLGLVATDVYLKHFCWSRCLRSVLCARVCTCVHVCEHTHQCTDCMCSYLCVSECLWVYSPAQKAYRQVEAPTSCPPQGTSSKAMAFHLHVRADLSTPQLIQALKWGCTSRQTPHPLLGWIHNRCVARTWVFTRSFITLRFSQWTNGGQSSSL